MDEPLACVPSAELGKARRIDDAAGRYIEFCKSTFPSELDLRGMRIVVDCAHGAGYHVAPLRFPRARRRRDRRRRRARRPQHQCGRRRDASAIPRRAGEARTRRDLGIALDGDGDRLLMVDQRGPRLRRRPAAVRDRDGLQAAQRARRRRRRHADDQPRASSRRSRRAGFRWCARSVGDRYVLEQLVEKRWMLGGENSGHLICLDKHTTGDGDRRGARGAARAHRAAARRSRRRRRKSRCSRRSSSTCRCRRGWDWRTQRRDQACRGGCRRRARRARSRAVAPVGHRAGAARDGRGARARARGRCTRRRSRRRSRRPPASGCDARAAMSSVMPPLRFAAVGHRSSPQLRPGGEPARRRARTASASGPRARRRRWTVSSSAFRRSRASAIAHG